jgi:hypothetical protein
MIRQPDTVTRELLDEARVVAGRRRPPDTIAKVQLERLAEGTAAQVMHVGPYAAEAATILRLHAFIAERGYEPAGRHHEIYLSDPRRTAAERLRTIVRQPVSAPAGRGDA